jgi:hypothetical protein
MGGSLVMSPRRKLIATTVRAELEAAGKTDSALGAVALTLAGRLDAGEDPGTAVASMAKELRAIMLELTRGGTVVADPVDELQRRRRERRLNAG